MKMNADQKSVSGGHPAQAVSPVLSSSFRIPTETLRLLVVDPRALTPGAAGAPDPREDLISKKELASRLKVSTRTITNWQRSGAVPFVKCGRSVYYNWHNVVAHLQSNFHRCPVQAEEPLHRVPVIGTAAEPGQKESK